MKSQGLVELFSQVEQLKSDVAKLRGQIEVLVYEQEQQQKRQRDLYVDLDSRLRKLEGRPGPGRGGRRRRPPPAAGGAAAPAPSGARAATNEQRAYDVALDQFKAGNYAAAIAGFGAFVKTFPKSALAPSAQYWIGNAQYAQRDFRGAIATQRQLIAAYPDSLKVPDAMLNIATASSISATPPASRRTLEDLVAKYPQVRRRDQGEAAARRTLTRGVARRTWRPRALARSPRASSPGSATHGRHDLPWQRTRDPYRIWLSEIMLQQTQVATVIPYYERFLAAFPDVRALAAAPEDRVLEHWSGLGYYRRAHHLHAAAKAIVAEHGGEFPRDVDTLATLPGIGRTTAAAIAAFAFGARAAILDGNVKRVLARHRGIDGLSRRAEGRSANCGASPTRCCRERDIETYTQALMDLGATVCTRSAPRCDDCPVARDCVARSEERIASCRRRGREKALPQRAVRVLVIERAGTILFEKRPAAGIWGGLWSLPEVGGRRRRRRALPRALRGDAWPRATSSRRSSTAFTHYRLTIHPQRIAVRDVAAARRSRRGSCGSRATTRSPRRCRRRSGNLLRSL